MFYVGTIDINYLVIPRDRLLSPCPTPESEESILFTDSVLSLLSRNFCERRYFRVYEFSRI